MLKQPLVALAVLLSAYNGSVYGFHSGASTPRHISTVSCAGSVAGNPCVDTAKNNRSYYCSQRPNNLPFGLYVQSGSSVGGGSDASSAASDVETSSVTHHHAAGSAATPPTSDIGINGAVHHAQNKITAADKVVIWTALTGIMSAFAAVVKISGPGAWRYYVAGGICAAVSHGITTPIDVVKVRHNDLFVMRY